jgi:hypothetical protein
MEVMEASETGNCKRSREKSIHNVGSSEIKEQCIGIKHVCKY